MLKSSVTIIITSSLCGRLYIRTDSEIMFFGNGGFGGTEYEAV